VDDLVDGITRLMRAPDGITGPVNLGNPDAFTLRALAEDVTRQTASRERCPDISRAHPRPPAFSSGLR
jgi:UDP-glucuronate decarboxylase